MLREHDVDALTQEWAGRRRVEKRCVLMGMNDLQLTPVDFAREAPHDLKIDPWTPVKLDDRNTFVAHALAKRANSVQADTTGSIRGPSRRIVSATSTSAPATCMTCNTNPIRSGSAVMRGFGSGSFRPKGTEEQFVSRVLPSADITVAAQVRRLDSSFRIELGYRLSDITNDEATAISLLQEDADVAVSERPRCPHLSHDEGADRAASFCRAGDARETLTRKCSRSRRLLSTSHSRARAMGPVTR